MIRDRIYEIAPKKDISIFSRNQLIKECNVAFKIIGYEPRNLENSVDEVFNSSDKPKWLVHFIIQVWRVDNASE